MLSAAARSRHSSNKINNLDPDDGNSWLCSACKLPIFATPFIGGGAAALLHDQCENLPKVLNDCELHRERPLLLGDHNINNQQTCSECSQICGIKLYYCPDSDCGLVLDVACALPIKILHRSHEHRLMAVRIGARSSGAICDVCGAAHDEAAAAAAELRSRSYFCNVCGFWIHPKCAALPSVIEHEKHEHPLVLYYDVHATFGAYDSSLFEDNFSWFSIFRSAPQQINEIHTRTCAICKDNVAKRCGIYSCITCRDYVIHVKCAKTFKSVSFGEAQFSHLVRLPFKDEHESVVRYALQTRRRSLLGSLTLHDRDDDIIISDDDDDQDPHCGRRLRVCDACFKIIDTSPFYSWSIWPDFFLHDYCYRLPQFLQESTTHTRGHQFALVPDDGSVKPKCHHCECPINIAYYLCAHKHCSEASFALHIWCALMPGVITHDAHSAMHFLRLTYEASSNSLDRRCYCCNLPLGKVVYECRTCSNFALHTWCALLPGTFTHKFDPHPLTLTTTAAAGVDIEKMICEICENGMKGGIWCYSCQICDQWFHIECIPCLELTYKIKSQAKYRQSLHDRVPTRLIRGLTLEGHAHDYCADVADEYDILPSD